MPAEVDHFSRLSEISSQWDEVKIKFLLGLPKITEEAAIFQHKFIHFLIPMVIFLYTILKGGTLTFGLFFCIKSVSSCCTSFGTVENLGFLYNIIPWLNSTSHFPVTLSCRIIVSVNTYDSECNTLN